VNEHCEPFYRLCTIGASDEIPARPAEPSAVYASLAGTEEEGKFAQAVNGVRKKENCAKISGYVPEEIRDLPRNSSILSMRKQDTLVLQFQQVTHW